MISRSNLRRAAFAAGLAILGTATVASGPASAQSRDCGSSVVVGFGDTLVDLARRCGTTVDAIMAVNPLLPSPRFIFPGLKIQMPAPPPPAPTVVRYVVKRGDTLLSIARAYGVTLGDIFRLNPDIDGASLRPGDAIRLPAGAIRPRPVPPGPPVNTFNYVVTPGDTLFSIARTNGVTVAQILALNPNLDASRLRAGDVIRLRGGVVPPQPPAPPPGIAAIVSPASGPPGTIVDVSASGFRASTPLRLMAGSKVASLQDFQEVTTDRRGNASISVRIPEWAAGPGTLVFAFETADGRLRAVSNTFRVASSPPPPRPTGVRVVGTLTREGLECQAMRGDDGRLYTLAGRDLGDFFPGDRVQVEGRVAQASICQQGTTIDVTRIGPAPQ